MNNPLINDTVFVNYENSDDSDDEFQKVKADKKRSKKVVQPAVAPQFPASDPTKIKIIGDKKEAQKPA